MYRANSVLRARSGIEVLLLDGHQRQTLSSLRSLSKRGLTVAVACSGPSSDAAFAQFSRWCKLRVGLPDVGASVERYATALLSQLDRQPADVVVPTNDGSIEAIRLYRRELETKTALALPCEAALRIAVDKEQTLAIGQALGIRSPRLASVRNDSDLHQAITDVGLPAVLKPTRSWAMNGSKGTRLTSVPVRTRDEASREWQYMASWGAQATLQEWLPGRRDAVSLFMSSGQVYARFAQTSHREFPLLGGVSVLAESIPLLDDISIPAERLVHEIGLDGPSMVEFRRDSQGKPVLMEINPRMAGSVQLAVRSGVDFPMMTYQWASDAPLTMVPGYLIGQRLRWLSGDILHLKTALTCERNLDVPGRVSAIGRFATDFVAHPAALDPFAFDDLLPTLVEWRETLISPLKTKVASLVRQSVVAVKKFGR